MHLLLTDALSCSRCGPEFGLVLRSDAIRERRVLEGYLGCPNCRAKYPVQGGIADLRRSADAVEPEVGLPEAMPDPSEALRLAALMGVTEGPGNVLLVGEASAQAGALSGVIPGVEVVALNDRRPSTPPSDASCLVGGSVIPFRSGALRAVALRGPWAEALLDEANRAVAPLGRLVLVNGSERAIDRFRALGLDLLADEGGTLVGHRR